MVKLEQAARRTNPLGILATGARILVNSLAAMRNRWRTYRDERELLSMPDHRLRDIGITRAEIAFRLRDKR